jgi:thiamine-monophosphate kinase
MGKDKISNSPVTSLGERKIIQIIKSQLTAMPNLPVPFGDDVSAVNLTQKKVAVLKTDMLIGKTDVPKNMSLWQAARKAIVMNISDFASKGVEPTAALVALGMPRDFNREAVEQIAGGLDAGAREYGAYVIGGDTSEASDLIISVSLFGTAQKTALMLRGGAKPGDVLAVTGFFGKSAAGLRLLMHDCFAPEDLLATLSNAVFMPRARLAEGLALGKSGAVSASIDSSDGLAWSLYEISSLSKVGFIIDRVPVADEVKRFAQLNGLDAMELTLYGGEEYELVVTVKPEKWAVAEASVKAVGGCLLPIGKATHECKVILDVDGEKRLVEARGWEHFKNQV